ncbi:hypothetical protein NP233_g13077 [Leucocoprinus birnbaumii]|uniref:BAH domain-containing protein n=1 Tax=Leucocoprinus birnbaumii TaxID=56174 RepID=A0AAD5YPC3_9AGAR|nr:hypothetical protein NP233_g13077 [Leucocoprinus birnbaumii]
MSESPPPTQSVRLPTLDQLRRRTLFKRLDEITLSRTPDYIALSQLSQVSVQTLSRDASETIKKKDILFVVGPDTKRGPEPHHAQTYWKVYVNAIYLGVSQEHVDWYHEIFLYCDYLYGKRDFGAVRLHRPEIKAEFIERLGETELVMSDVPGIIHGSTVEDKCELYRFESHRVNEPDIPPGSWYYRYELTHLSDKSKGDNDIVHGKIKDLQETLCECGKTYSPDSERQIFCKHCRRWLHVDCCDVYGPRFEDSEPTLAQQLASAPRTRGVVEDAEPNDWNIAGSGRNLNKYARWVERNPGEEEEEAEKYFVDKFGWAFYNAVLTDLKLEEVRCPRCSTVL